jgi:hypothetical protein
MMRTLESDNPADEVRWVMVACLVKRTDDFESGGQGFESLPAYNRHPQSQEMDTRRPDPSRFCASQCSHPCATGTSFKQYLLEHPRKTRVGRFAVTKRLDCFDGVYTRCYTSYGKRAGLHASLRPLAKRCCKLPLAEVRLRCVGMVRSN